jgi:hypothetical protein
MFKSEKFKFSLIALTAFTALALSACELRVPTSDSTPPTIRLEITGFGETIVLTESSAPVERIITSASARINMLATGIDEDGGVSNVYIAGETSSNCVSGDIGRLQTASYLADNPDTSASGPGDEAYDTRLAALNLRIANFANLCERVGYTLTSVSGAFRATAVNFHSGRTSTPVFSFRYVVPVRTSLETTGLPDLITVTPSDSEESTPTPQSPTVNSVAPCWQGPGDQYPLVFNLQPGTLVTLLGLAQTGSWFIIELPDSPGAACWIEMRDIDVDPSLDFSALVIYPLPPLPSGGDGNGGGQPPSGPPAAPSGLSAQTVCSSPTYNVKLTWNDNASNEQGFRIYRDGAATPIGTVGANVKQFTDPNPSNSSGHSYEVQAYNAAGESSSVKVESDGCIF